MGRSSRRCSRFLDARLVAGRELFIELAIGDSVQSYFRTSSPSGSIWSEDLPLRVLLYDVSLGANKLQSAGKGGEAPLRCTSVIDDVDVCCLLSSCASVGKLCVLYLAPEVVYQGKAYSPLRECANLLSFPFLIPLSTDRMLRVVHVLLMAIHGSA